ncbi:MAG: NYN domain-containing protein [Acidimicrobiales bacterium]
MPIEHIIVDGSNIATEGRSSPSLAQLEEAVAELRRDHPDAEITVIVDATFAHRIDPSELARFEEAELRGEYVHPPAGAIGRGDAFLLRVAEKVDGTVLSNDSFQEFHGEHPWLFERGRLLGATPVPGIGWIFSPRQPVRGPRSHQAVRETQQAKKRVSKAIAVATKEVVKPGGKSQATAASRSHTNGGGTAPAKAAVASRDRDKHTPLAVNDPLAFISFIAEHRLGEQLEGEVESYTSHGAVVRVGEMRCYVPLANLGDPAPRSAREVLKRNQRREFVLTALDPQRRGAELALPGMARVSGHPREETVAAEVRLAQPPRRRGDGSVAGALEPARKPPAAKAVPAKAVPAKAVPVKAVPVKAMPVKAEPVKAEPEKAVVPIKAVPGKAVPEGPAREKVAARKAPAPRAAARAATPRASTRKEAAQKAPTEKTTGKKAVPEKAVPEMAAAQRASAPKASTQKAAAIKPAAKKVALRRGPAGRPATRTAPEKAVAGRTRTGKAAPEKAVAGRTRAGKAAPEEGQAKQATAVRARAENLPANRARATTSPAAKVPKKTRRDDLAVRKTTARKSSTSPKPTVGDEVVPAPKPAVGRRSPRTAANAR